MEQADFSSVRILLVGSKTHSVQTLRSVLGIAGVGRVIQVEDSARAIEMLRVDQFSAVCCEQTVAPVDGMAFPLAARRLPGMVNPMIPVFVLKERARRHDVEKARDIGATDFITTPISPKTVMTKLEAAIFRPRAFIVAPEFFGPDRRAARAPYAGHERRVRAAKKTKIDFTTP